MNPLFADIGIAQKHLTLKTYTEIQLLYKKLSIINKGTPDR